jgi:hypothetical protein
MHLYQEYFNRKKIDKEQVRYADKSIIFTNDLSNKVLLIEKKISNVGPNKFIFLKLKPNKGFLRSFESFEIEWDDYEDYIYKNLKYKKNAILDSEDVFIFGWELFISCNDSFFSDNICYKTLYSTINRSLSKCDKIKNINNLISILNSDYKIIYNSWLIMQKDIDNYSYWLARLVNDIAI